MEGMSDSQVKLLMELIIVTLKDSKDLDEAIQKIEAIKENSLGK